MSDKRLFFALWPTDRQREALRDPIKAAASAVEGQLVLRGDWHVTLNFLGAFPEEKIANLAEAVAAIRVEPFRLRFDRLDFWPRPKIASMVAATVPPELESLVLALHALMQDFGLVPDDRAYRPHITVVRNARTFTTERLTQRVATEWSSFELVESVGEPGGQKYIPVKQ
ncbi:MAG: RNA 2',3'-cyclic phosphodiesterase [Erythrobacter sp.]|nr:RNA 2',3'-cyclic phosphodiesterase [Erythrobacter sp.]